MFYGTLQLIQIALLLAVTGVKISFWAEFKANAIVMSWHSSQISIRLTDANLW